MTSFVMYMYEYMYMCYMLRIMMDVMIVDDYEYKPNHFTEMSC